MEQAGLAFRNGRLDVEASSWAVMNGRGAGEGRTTRGGIVCWGTGRESNPKSMSQSRTRSSGSSSEESLTSTRCEANIYEGP